jgi:hypothetical protein
MLEPEYLFTVVEHFELEFCVHNYNLYETERKEKIGIATDR